MLPPFAFNGQMGSKPRASIPLVKGLFLWPSEELRFLGVQSTALVVSTLPTALSSISIFDPPYSLTLVVAVTIQPAPMGVIMRFGCLGVAISL